MATGRRARAGHVPRAYVGVRWEETCFCRPGMSSSQAARGSVCQDRRLGGTPAHSQDSSATAGKRGRRSASGGGETTAGRPAGRPTHKTPARADGRGNLRRAVTLGRKGGRTERRPRRAASIRAGRRRRTGRQTSQWSGGNFPRLRADGSPPPPLYCFVRAIFFSTRSPLARSAPFPCAAAGASISFKYYNLAVVTSSGPTNRWVKWTTQKRPPPVLDETYDSKTANSSGSSGRQ